MDGVDKQETTELPIATITDLMVAYGALRRALMGSKVKYADMPTQFLGQFTEEECQAMNRLDRALSQGKWVESGPGIEMTIGQRLGMSDRMRRLMGYDDAHG